MTQKEKDWVLKVQFMQLQPKDASIDDYYYQVWWMTDMLLLPCVLLMTEFCGSEEIKEDYW